MYVRSQGGLTARELMSVLGASSKDYAAVLYRVFIDDSSDEKKELVMVAGALIGTHKQWSRLQRAWRLRLRREKISYFRSTEYFSLRGEFARFRDPVAYPKPKGSEAAAALRADLEAIIKNCEIVGIADVIPMKMFRTIIARPDIGYRFNPDPFSAAMQSVMRNASKIVRDHLPGGESNKIAFVCDDSPNASHLSAAYTDFKRKNVWLSSMMGGLAHLDDKKNPQLQAADMVASLGKELALEHLRTGQRVPLKRLEGAFYRLSMWKEETILQIVNSQP